MNDQPRCSTRQAGCIATLALAPPAVGDGGVGGGCSGVSDTYLD